MIDNIRAWSTESRLQFIELRLYWEGKINRSDLINHFNISVPQASLDLKKYLEIAPENVEYDKRRKAYFPTKNFLPKLIQPSSKNYLAQLEAINAEIESQFSYQSFISNPPDFDIVPLPDRKIRPEILREVVTAIQERKSINILYQSMSSVEPTHRWITPHAIASDGFRWHIRAYCNNRNSFIDFVFGRILEICDTRDSDIHPSMDKEWNTLIELTIAPNRELANTQKKIIELDYGMQNGVSKLVARKALVNYLKKKLGFSENISTDTIEQKFPHNQQIILINEVELT